MSETRKRKASQKAEESMQFQNEQQMAKKSKCFSHADKDIIHSIFEVENFRKVHLTTEQRTQIANEFWERRGGRKSKIASELIDDFICDEYLAYRNAGGEKGNSSILTRNMKKEQAKKSQPKNKRQRSSTPQRLESAEGHQGSKHTSPVNDIATNDQDSDERDESNSTQTLRNVHLMPMPLMITFPCPVANKEEIVVSNFLVGKQSGEAVDIRCSDGIWRVAGIDNLEEDMSRLDLTIIESGEKLSLAPKKDADRIAPHKMHTYLSEVEQRIQLEINRERNNSEISLGVSADWILLPYGDINSSLGKCNTLHDPVITDIHPQSMPMMITWSPHLHSSVTVENHVVIVMSSQQDQEVDIQVNGSKTNSKSDKTTYDRDMDVQDNCSNASSMNDNATDDKGRKLFFEGMAKEVYGSRRTTTIKTNDNDE